MQYLEQKSNTIASSDSSAVDLMLQIHCSEAAECQNKINFQILVSYILHIDLTSQFHRRYFKSSTGRNQDIDFM